MNKQTQCPKCKRAFEVSGEAFDTTVSCPACDEKFNPTREWFEEGWRRSLREYDAECARAGRLRLEESSEAHHAVTVEFPAKAPTPPRDHQQRPSARSVDREKTASPSKAPPTSPRWWNDLALKVFSILLIVGGVFELWKSYDFLCVAETTRGWLISAKPSPLGDGRQGRSFHTKTSTEYSFSVGGCYYKGQSSLSDLEAGRSSPDALNRLPITVYYDRNHPSRNAASLPSLLPGSVILIFGLGLCVAVFPRFFMACPAFFYNAYRRGMRSFTNIGIVAGKMIATGMLCGGLARPGQAARAGECKTLEVSKMDDEKKKVGPALRVATVLLALAAAGVLVGALGRHPYSYYTVLRWLACSAAVVLVWRGAVQGVKWAWALVPLAILFNPVAPIHFSRETWRSLDIVAAVVMVLAVILMEIAVLLRKKD